MGILVVVLADSVRRQFQELQLRCAVVWNDTVLRFGILCGMLVQGIAALEDCVAS